MPAAALPSKDDLLTGIPDSLRQELVDEFGHIVANFREGRWGPAELDGGRFCEIVYSILKGYVDGKFPASASKPPDMVGACKALEQADKDVFPRSIRIQIPRMLMGMYEIRNNRGVGHVGGDVDPNEMDAVAILQLAKWILAELVRVFHNTDTATATEAIGGLVSREVPIVWEVEGMKRVLQPGLTYLAKSLVLLYAAQGGVREEDLLEWVEHPRKSDFRKKVLRPAHKDRLLEFQEKEGLVYLSPLGARYVEDELPLAV